MPIARFLTASAWRDGKFVLSHYAARHECLRHVTAR
jgi:hypothetical protein